MKFSRFTPQPYRYTGIGMRTLVYVQLLGCLFCGLNVPCLASVTTDAVVAATRAAHPLAPDPALADPEWHRGAVALDAPFENLTTRTQSVHRTSVWMLYDEHNLYVAFQAEQAGSAIVATQTTNDVGFGVDDFVGVGIDTSGVGSQSYYFETTPRGVRYEQANENSRYKPAWTSAATISPGSHTWNAVMIIPLSAMRIHPGSPQTWRVNFIRNVAASGEHYSWAYNGLMQDGVIGSVWPNFYDVRYFASWDGVQVTRAMLAASRTRPRLDVYGLGSVGSNRNLFQQANGQFLSEKARPGGLDVTYPVTPTVNFVGTLNPDFSNVEIDQQTIAPQEFRRALVEYRPFFAQGAAFINANAVQIGPDIVFYSPNIGPFDRGEKLEGTFGKQSFGVLNFRGFDQTTGNTFDDTAYGYKHALQNRTFLYWADGVIAHHSAFGNDTTNEFGIAGRNLKTGFVWGIDQAWEHGTWVPQGSAYSTTGFVDVHKPNYEVNLTYQDLSPNYNPIDGFTADSDIRGPVFYAWVGGSTSFIKNYQFTVNADRYIDRSGQVHQADAFAGLNATLRNGFSINGLGPSIGELRSYAVVDPAQLHVSCNSGDLPRSYFTGWPGYFCGRDDAYNLFTIPLGYGDGTPTPIDGSVSFGRFGYGMLGPRDNGQDFVQLYSLSTSRPVGHMLSLGLEFDGTVERGLVSGLRDSQWLRRVSIGALLDRDSNLTISLRGINGRGGFALPGVNFAAAFHRKFRSGDELFVNYGTPAAPYTLNRLIMKYVFHFGGDS